jgi:hypothetical protein
VNNQKVRAKAHDISGRNRYDLLKSVISRYNYATKQSFFHEATALIESLICDRLESRQGELTNQPVQFDTIGRLLSKLNKIENDVDLCFTMNNSLKDWWSNRNIVTHEAAKIQQGINKTWTDS